MGGKTTQAKIFYRQLSDYKNKNKLSGSNCGLAISTTKLEKIRRSILSRALLTDSYPQEKREILNYLKLTCISTLIPLQKAKSDFVRCTRRRLKETHSTTAITSNRKRNLI